MAEHICQMLLEDGTPCLAPAGRFITTTFGHHLHPDIKPWKVQHWLCDEHIKYCSEHEPSFVIDGVPIVSEVLKEEF